LAAANAYAAEHDLPGFVASQIGYCLAEADAEMQGTMGGLVYMTPEYGESMRKLNIPLFAYTSQGAGFFSGRFDWQNARDERDGKAWFLKQLFGNEYNKERYNRVQTLACELEVSPTALALTWLLRQPHPTLPLIGPGSLEQLEDSLSAADIELSNEQCNWLNLKDRPSE
jgi:aryl-alcohol dehydrogenase-like predicted oxidoreductase